MLPLAPGANGQPPRPPTEASRRLHAGLDRGQRVGLAGAAGVVEVDADVEPGRLGADGVEQGDGAQRRHRADRVAEAELIGAPRAGERTTSRVRCGSVGPSNGQSQAVAMMTSSEPPASCASAAISPIAAAASAVWASGVGQAVRVGGRHHVLEVGDDRRRSPGPRRAGSRPARRSGRRASGRGARRARRRRPARARPWARRSWSPRRGGRRSATSASSMRSFASRGTGSSSCRPSRMPTSRMSIVVGELEVVHRGSPSPSTVVADGRRSAYACTGSSNPRSANGGHRGSRPLGQPLDEFDVRQHRPR